MTQESAKKQRSLRFVTTNELLEIPRPDYLIEGVLERNSFNVLYGAPGGGKSFVALDMALHIATGRPWMGHSVRAGAVIYVAAEGYQSMARRVAAWLDLYRLDRGMLRDLNWVIEPVHLMGGAATLVQFLTEAVGSLRGDEVAQDPDSGEAQLLEEAPSLELVIFDTMSRCITGADENDAKDMGSVVQWLDQLRDKEFTGLDTSTLVVHHTGKTGIIERGSSVLRGAADTMLYLKRDGGGPVLVCSKQKNDEPFENIPLRIHRMPSGDAVLLSRAAALPYMAAERTREEAIERGEYVEPRKGDKPPALNARQLRFMAMLSASPSSSGLGLTEMSKQCDIPIPTLWRIRGQLERLGYVYKDPETSKALLTAPGAYRLIDENILRPEDVADEPEGDLPDPNDAEVSARDD